MKCIRLACVEILHPLFMQLRLDVTVLIYMNITLIGLTGGANNTASFLKDQMFAFALCPAVNASECMFFSLLYKFLCKAPFNHKEM